MGEIKMSNIVSKTELVVVYEDIEYTVLDVAFLVVDSEYMSMTETPEFTSIYKGTRFYKIDRGSEGTAWVHSSFEVKEDVEEVADEFFEEDTRSPHLTELGYSMVGWLDGLESRPDNDNLPPVVTMLMAIQYDKEGGYGSSWKGKGEYRGIMSNIDRKYDRLDKMTMDEIEGKVPTLGLLEDHLVTGRWEEDKVGESKIDAIADLTNYGLLYMTYVKEKYPNVFKVWVSKNIPQYLHDKIPFLQTPHKE